MQKHTPGWTLEDVVQPEEGQTSQRPKPAKKAKEKPAKKACWTKEIVEKGLVVENLIKFKLRKPKQEPEDFIQKFRHATTDKEVEEEPTETLIRRSKKRDQKQRAEESAPTVVVETQEREEPGNGQSVEPVGQPAPSKERVPSLGLSTRQPKQQPERPLNKDAQSTSTEGGAHGLEHGTCQQWLRCLGEKVSDVADRLDEEQRSRGHLMRMMTKELEKVRAQMQSMEEELTRAKESVATMGQQSNVDTELVGTTR